MSQYVEVKTAELIGPALDWVVAKVEGCSCTPRTIKRFYRMSTDWSQGGSLTSYAVEIARLGDVVQVPECLLEAE